MSEQSQEADLVLGEGFAFGSFMDVLAPEGDGASAAADAGSADGAGGQGGQPAGQPGAGGPGAGGAAAPSTGAAGGPADTGAAAPTAGAPVAGGTAGPAGGGAAGAAGDAPAGGAGSGTDGAGGVAGSVGPVIDHAVLTEQLGGLTTKIEERIVEGFQATALGEVKEEYPKYFDMLEQHPFAMVGTRVPAIGREGEMVLNSTQDARDWQEAVKGLLAAEVRDRASREFDANRSVVQTLHSSVELFQRNKDLVPGVQGFDTDLANRFAAAVKPYELRVDGKLQGFTVPTQPIIDALRSQLVSERAAAGAPAAGAPASAPAAPAQGTQASAAGGTPDQPQAGIASKAGTSSDREDFSTLFGTIGLPNLQI